MAIGRISGPMLFSNLERQGVDLAFQSNLLYLDVNNLRVGVINDTPQYAFDSSGNVKLANIVILGNTITSNTGVINLGSTSNIVITGGATNNVLYTDGLGNLSWGQISDLDLSWDNLSVITGNAGIWYADTLNSTYANLTNATVTNISTSNIIISSGNITANLTGNITGTNATFSGNVDAEWTVANVDAVVGNFFTINTSSNVNVVGTLTATGNVVAQKITSSLGDLHISAATNDPNNIIRFDSVSAFDIPSGTTAERPPSPDYGYVRYNTDIGSIEWWGGSSWVPGSNLVISENITPDGSTSIYTLLQSTTENGILVNINGTIQQAGTGAYSVSGNQITFAEAPLVTDIIEIRYIAGGVAALSWQGGNVSQAINIANSASSTSTTTGALIVAGGVGIAGNLNVAGIGNMSANVGSLLVNSLAQSANLGAFQNYANTKIGTNSNSNLVVISSTEAASTTTGALVVTGGAGIGGNLHLAGNVNLSTTTGTPGNTSTPASWLKVYVGGSEYFLPLYQ